MDRLTFGAGVVGIRQVRTGAEDGSGTEEANVRAVAVAPEAWILAELFVTRHGADLHETLETLAEDTALFSTGLVDPLDGFAPPVGPVKESAQLRQSKRMCGALDELDAESAAQISRFYAIQLGVGPIETLSVVVDGQSVGPTQFRRDDGQPPSSVHEGSLDLGIGAPIRPVK